MPAGSAPKLTIVGGPNGSGKTTFALEYLREFGGIFLNADEIAKQLSAETAAQAHLAAGRILLEKLDESFKASESLLLETTFSGRTLRGHIETARGLGYSVEMVLVFLESADASVLRVQQRVLAGGHNVPEADIRRRYDRSLSNFWNYYREIADVWSIYYNGVSGFALVIEGDDNSSDIYDDFRFQQFRELLL